ASEPYIIPAVDGTYEVVAKDEKGNQAKTTITIKLPVAEPEDEEAPVIKVGDDVLGATANYEESVTLTITDNKGVASVTINGTPASEPYIIPAVDGTYEVVAKDEKGNQAKTTITIKLPVVIEPEPGDITIIESSGVQTTVFRTIKTDDFSGIEVLAKEKMSIEVYDESGKRVKVGTAKMEDGATRVAMPVGKYKVNMGMFKSLDLEIK
ncbi:MAG: hypothetical protein MJZ31_02565, partial [Bacteroidales bacterium]|nr:hypothetical protein [Bacteroidales bacterium]